MKNMSIYNGIIIDDLTDKGFGDRLHSNKNGDYLNTEENIGIKNTILQTEKIEIIACGLIRKQRTYTDFYPAEEVRAQITVSTEAPRNFPLEISWIKK